MAELSKSGLAPIPFGNTCLRPVRHDYKRAVYRAMLSEFSLDDIKDFFSRVPLVIDGKEIRGAELFRMLWRKKAYVTFAWEYGTDNILERFLIDKGSDPHRFTSKILWLNGGNSVIPGKVVLSWCYPMLEGMFRSLDTRDMCLTWMCNVTEKMLPGTLHRRIRKRESEGWVESAFVYITHADHREYQDWDMEFIGGPQMVSCPKMVGLPSFEQFVMLADTRPPEIVVWNASDATTTRGDMFLISGEPYGLRLPFLEHCRLRELDVSPYAPPNPDVIVIEKDYRCPIRGRIVLHAGCAYGAPFFIHQIGYQRLKEPRPGRLDFLIQDFDREDSEDLEATLERRHLELLESFRGTADFTYSAVDERLALDGKALAKGIQAKILRNVLNAYIHSGRTRFEYHEFKRDFEISLGQKNANFEVRLYRLISRLNASEAPVRIEKSGRGEFTLRTDAEIRLQEVD